MPTKQGRFPQGVSLLLWNGLIMCIGFYAFIPYLSYYLNHNLGWSPFAIGLLLMVRQLSQQGLMIFTGILADRIGYRPTLAVGFFLRGLGFAMFAFVTTPSLLYVCAIVAGVGGSLFEPTGDAALSSLIHAGVRTRVYSIKKVFDNLGIVLSAFIGAVIMQFNFDLLSIVSGALFIVLGITTLVRLPNIQVQVRKIPMRSMFQSVARDGVFLRFVLCNIGFYFMYMQLFLTLPIRVVSITHDGSSVSLVNLVLAVILMTGQVPITRLVSGRNSIANIQSGLILMTLGLLVIGAAGSILWFMSGVAVYALGIIFVEPASFDVTTRLASKTMTATYFGFYYLAMAIGGGLSQGTGGYLLQIGNRLHTPLLLFLVCALIACVSIIGLQPLRKTLQPIDEAIKDYEHSAG